MATEKGVEEEGAGDMEPVNPYQTPGAPAAVDSFRFMPDGSLIRGAAFGLLVAIVVTFGIRLLGDGRPLGYSFFPACGVVLISGLGPSLAHRKKREDLRAAPPHFEGATLLCAGIGRIRTSGWLVKEVMIFVTSRALVLREKLEDTHHDVTIPFEEIATVEVARFALRVTRHDGQTQQIIVSHPRQWLQEIEAVQQGGD